MNPNTPILVGGDFNAHRTAWGYSTNSARGTKLIEMAENTNLQLINDTVHSTRISLHPSQNDTTPDLTWASPGLAKSWVPYSTSWGSDHLPILITLRGKRIRDGRNIQQRIHLDWGTFRDRLLQYDPPTSLEMMAEIIRSSSVAASEYIKCEEDSPTLDNHPANVCKRMEYLTQLYRSTGRRHNQLPRIRNQYKIINHYEKQLSNENWANLS